MAQAAFRVKMNKDDVVVEAGDTFAEHFFIVNSGDFLVEHSAAANRGEEGGEARDRHLAQLPALGAEEMRDVRREARRQLLERPALRRRRVAAGSVVGGRRRQRVAQPMPDHSRPAGDAAAPGDRPGFSQTAEE